MLPNHGQVHALRKIFGKLNATFDDERILDFDITEGNSEVNFTFRVSVDHVTNTGRAAIKALRKTRQFALFVFPNQGRNVGCQQQT